MEPFRGFAKIEGFATLGKDGLDFEYRITESPGSGPKETVIRHLGFDRIISIELREHWLSASRLRFRTRSAQALEGYPTIDPLLFEIEVAARSRSILPAFHEALQAMFRGFRQSAPAAGGSA